MTLKRTVGLTLALTWSACAHQQKQELAVEPTAARPVPEQRLEVTPAAPDDSQAGLALEAALKSGQVLFEFDSDNLQPQGTATLQQVGQALKKDARLRVRVEGNCDERGTTEYNVVLGQRRAEVARRYLEALGVKPSQVDTVSYGAERPVNPEHTEAAWAQNRRDDVKRITD